jgi:hypothetical protein
MVTLRACDGTVSSEQRSTIGSSAVAARVNTAGAATIAAVVVMNVRRDIDFFIFFS